MCDVIRFTLFRVCVWPRCCLSFVLLQDEDVAQVASLAVDVEAIAYDEFWRDAEPYVVGAHGGLQRLGLEQERCQLDGLGMLLAKDLYELFGSDPRVDDVFNDDYRPAFDVFVQPHHLFHGPGRRSAFVGLEPDERYFRPCNFAGAEQVGGKYGRAV